SALEQDPSSAELAELLGLAHAEIGNKSAAIRSLEDATKLDPRRVSAHYNLALLLSSDNRIEDAIEENQAALFLSPTHGPALELATVLRRRMRDKISHSAEDFGVVSYRPDPLHDSP